VTAIGPNTMSPVKNQERRRWLKERWKVGGKGSDTGNLSALRIHGMATRLCSCKTNASRVLAFERQ
jgi:hypothetical protein